MSLVSKCGVSFQIQEVPWMDPNTRHRAKEKAESIVPYIGEHISVFSRSIHFPLFIHYRRLFDREAPNLKRFVRGSKHAEIGVQGRYSDATLREVFIRVRLRKFQEHFSADERFNDLRAEPGLFLASFCSPLCDRMLADRNMRERGR